MGRPPWDTFLRQDRQWLFQGTDEGPPGLRVLGARGWGGLAAGRRHLAG